MFKDFRPIIIALLRFFGIYMVFIIVYQLYLNAYNDTAVDPLTRLVAHQTQFCLNKTGYTTYLVDDIESKGIYFYIKEMWATIMIEGCNAVSIMILYLAFIFAFYKGLKTFWFASAGLVFLYVVNIIRIVALNVVVVDHPKYTDIAHDYFFPAIIYGGVVVLWLIWIKFFALKK
ncbi:MAG: exosortase family protein XrtF [Cloacibacterium sp.]|nr:exosortase family protein XrtF [Cloacibacterium sp.]